MAEDVLLSESRGVRVVFVALVFFNFIYARVPHKRPRQVFALRRDGSGGCMAREAAVPRASLYIVLFRLSDDSNDDIHFIISITKQLLLKLSRVIGHF